MPSYFQDIIVKKLGKILLIMTTISMIILTFLSIYMLRVHLIDETEFSALHKAKNGMITVVKDKNNTLIHTSNISIIENGSMYDEATKSIYYSTFCTYVLTNKSLDNLSAQFFTCDHCLRWNAKNHTIEFLMLLTVSITASFAFMLCCRSHIGSDVSNLTYILFVLTILTYVFFLHELVFYIAIPILLTGTCYIHYTICNSKVRRMLGPVYGVANIRNFNRARLIITVCIAFTYAFIGIFITLVSSAYLPLIKQLIRGIEISFNSR